MMKATQPAQRPHGLQRKQKTSSSYSVTTKAKLGEHSLTRTTRGHGHMAIHYMNLFAMLANLAIYPTVNFKAQTNIPLINKTKLTRIKNDFSTLANNISTALDNGDCRTFATKTPPPKYHPRSGKKYVPPGTVSTNAKEKLTPINANHAAVVKKASSANQSLIMD
jgi:hypothetical protein